MIKICFVASWNSSCKTSLSGCSPTNHQHSQKTNLIILRTCIYSFFLQTFLLQVSACLNKAEQLRLCEGSMLAEGWFERCLTSDRKCLSNPCERLHQWLSVGDAGYSVEPAWDAQRRFEDVLPHCCHLRSQTVPVGYPFLIPGFLEAGVSCVYIILVILPS